MATMAAMNEDCKVVESDARTFNERLAGPAESPAKVTKPEGEGAAQ